MSVVGSNALAGASGQAGAASYEIERSLRFNNDDDAHLERDITAAGDQQKMTFSFWIKRNSVDSSDESAIIAQDYDTSASNHVTARSLSMHFQSNTLKLYDYGASTGPGNTGSSSIWYPGSVENGKLFRDPAAWTHCVFAIDTTQATAANRCKVWINGESQTHSTQPPQNAHLSWGQVRKHYIGIQKVNGSFTRAGDFQLSEFHFIDGQQLAASDFGEYDSNNNWNPKEFEGSYGPTGGTAISAANGAVPILNTSGDQGGTVTSGVRSDSNSANIVLALPLNGSNGGTTITDYHHTIKGSGSAKTVSIYTGSASGGAVTSTAVSRYYGSSFYAVRGATNNYTASDYIYRTGDSDLDLGTGSFCVEFWYYPTSLQSNCGIFDNRHPSTSWPNDANGFALIINGSGNIFSYSGGNQIINHSSKLTAGQWHHIAYTRDGSTERLFVNGDFFGSTASSSRNYNRQRFYLGTTANNGEGSDGYYQDFRMYKGVAKYTANFTPPELGPGGVNSFYLKFADNSSNAALGTDSSGQNNTFTVNNISAADQTSSTGKSWFFDGSSGIDANDSRLALGTGDWTVEYFILPWNNYSGQSAHVGYQGNNPYFETDGSAKIRWQVGSTYGSSLTYPNWYHVAHVADGGQGAIFVNGTRVATNLSLSGFDATDGRLRIGQRVDGTTGARALFSNVHIVVGTAKYKRSQSTIPIPHTPIPLHPDTQLLALSTTDRTEDVSNNNITLTVTSGAGISVNNPPTIGANIYGDSTIDSPTNYDSESGNNRGNYATLNPLSLRVNGGTISEGNLLLTASSNQYIEARSTIAASVFDNYSELTVTKAAGASDVAFGVGDKDAWIITGGGSYLVYRESGLINRFPGNTTVANVASFTQGDVLGIAVDSTNVKFYKNGSLQGTYAHQLTGDYFVTVMNIANNVDTEVIANFGQQPFSISTVPAGYKSLCAQNLPEPTIKDGSTAMDVSLWTGNGTSQTISGLNHSPDLVWSKARSFGADHEIYDIVRGAGKRLYTSLTNAESSPSTSVNSFTSDGFTVTGGGGVNNNTSTYVGWTWDAGSSTVTNTDGSITSQVRASASNGFSIITYTGNSSGGSGNVGHGLNATPDFIIFKTRDAADNWAIYHSSLGQAYLEFTTSGQGGNAANRWSSLPTSSVIHLGSDTNINTKNHLLYAWSAVEGYSAFGKYTGNGSADGPFVYTGLRPRWVLLKESSSAGELWVVYDTARNTSNVMGKQLYPSSSAAEADASADTHARIDFLSNGFKIRGSHSSTNTNAETIIYAAFAEHPFKTARAR